ncbi:MAG TPA: hypothetical protein VIF57_01095 [Polyangia bacterium]|jgi:hypothetical protein
MTRWVVLAVPVAVASLAASGCGVRSLDPPPATGSGASSGSGAGGAGDAAASTVSTPDRPPCGGTVETTGTTPAGPFTASTVWAEYYPCGIDITLWIHDGSAFALQLVARVQLADGGANLETEAVAAKAKLFALAPSTGDWTTSGTLTITSANNPYNYDYDAGTRPGIAGTFALSDDGFSLSGSFSTPYCAFSICGTE